MKKIKLALVAAAMAIFATSNVNAQGIEGGTVLMGGSMGFSSSTASTSANGKEVQSGSQFQFSLSPKMGYFFFRNFAAGMLIDFNTASRTTTADTSFFGREVSPSTQESETQLLAGPFFRYYFFPTERVGLFGELSIGLGAGSVDQGSRKSSVGQFNIGFGPGLTFFANEIVAIEALAKYNILNQTTSVSDPRGQSVDATTRIGTINVGVGFQFYFNRVIGGGPGLAPR